MSLVCCISFMCSSSFRCCRLYISPSLFTSLNTRFQFDPPYTENSNFVQLNSSVCISDRLYHAISCSGVILQNCFNIMFSSRSLHISAAMSCLDRPNLDATASIISDRSASVKANPLFEDSSNNSLLIVYGWMLDVIEAILASNVLAVSLLPRSSTTATMFFILLNTHLLSSRV